MRCAAVLLLAGAALADALPVRYVDVTDDVGLGGLAAARVAFADLNANGLPDAVIDRHRVFLNVRDAEAPFGFHFVEVERPGLPVPRPGDSVVFADLNNDGILDAIVVRYLDVNREGYEPPAEPPAQTAWLKGRGDGTFGEAQIIEAATPATTAAVAVGDVDLDGRLDLYMGNWYTRYGQSLEAFPNDLLVQRDADGRITFERQPLAEDQHEFDADSDLAGRPTYGVMIASVLSRAPTEGPGAVVGGLIGLDGVNQPVEAARVPQLLELNYGRRANRLWADHSWRARPDPIGFDHAPMIGFDGDDIRHGRHPDWLKIIAQRDPRFDRADEKPFRSHGNTFDVAVGDVTNDGSFDIFLAEITHGWAGESSDRSRLLIARQVKTDPLTMLAPSAHSFDRVPPIPPEGEWPEGWFPRWNQGDLFCEFADLDNDGLVDVIISSGDYPDPAPYDQRLRIYRQNQDGSFEDVTPGSGIDHIGSQQISLADVDGDGQLDILVGQSFTRFTREMIDAAGGEPRVRLYLNRTHAAASAEEQTDEQPHGVPNAITLRLVGDPAQGVNRDALGAIIRLHTGAAGRAAYQSRQLIGIGGHAGKQHQFLVHFGLGDAKQAEKIEIVWPTSEQRVTTLREVAPGHHIIRLD